MNAFFATMTKMDARAYASMVNEAGCTIGTMDSIARELGFRVMPIDDYLYSVGGQLFTIETIDTRSASGTISERHMGSIRYRLHMA